MNIKSACQSWVQEFNEVPGSVLGKLMHFDDSVHEITPFVIGETVRVVFDEYAGEEGEIVEINEDTLKIKLNSGETIEKYKNDIESAEYKDVLPMYSWLWTFGSVIDEEWLTGKYGKSHLQEMANLGFRIYESEDYGIVFGIDGAGYDFYEAHWIPLYKLRGLKWHTEEAV